MRTIGKLLSQALLLLGPMLTLPWSFLNLVGYQGGPADPITVKLLFLSITDQKSRLEIKFRVAVSLAGLVLMIIFEIVDTVLPRRSLAQFRKSYLAEQKKIWKAQLMDVVKGLRISILQVQHPWYTLFFGKFRWVWSEGFDYPNQRDVNLFMFTRQGLAGRAYRDQEILRADFRELPPQAPHTTNYKVYLAGVVVALPLIASIIFILRSELPEFKTMLELFVVLIAVIALLGFLNRDRFQLWPWQSKRVRRIQYILSVPLFRESQTDSRSWKPVGVLNVDATTEEGAAFLRKNEKELAEYFFQVGKVIARLL